MCVKIKWISFSLTHGNLGWCQNGRPSWASALLAGSKQLCTQITQEAIFFIIKINPVWTSSSSLYCGKITNKKQTNKQTKGTNSVAEREGRVSHNAAAHAVILACLLSFFFFFFMGGWRRKLGSLGGARVNMGAGNEVCGAAVRLEL